MITKIEGPCQYDGCGQPATGITARSDSGPAKLYCAKHEAAIIDEKNPEYTVTCPNCTCSFGVN